MFVVDKDEEEIKALSFQSKTQKRPRAAKLPVERSKWQFYFLEFDFAVKQESKPVSQRGKDSFLPAARPHNMQ